MAFLLEENLSISKKNSTFAAELVFGVRERRTFERKPQNLSGYERAGFGYTFKENDVKRT